MNGEKGIYFALSLALGGAMPGRADITLVYGQGTDTGEVPAATHQVMIQGTKLAIANAMDKRLLIYDAATGQAQVVDRLEKMKMDLTAEAVEKLAARLVASQRLALAEIEKKMSKMSKEDREGLRPTLDLLQLATGLPEKLDLPPYRMEDSGHDEVFLGVATKGAWLLRGDRKIAQTLVASPEALGLSAAEKTTFLSLQRHLDRLTQGLPPALRSQLGLSGMVAPDGRLVLKSLPQAAGESRLELRSATKGRLESGWFEAPGDCETVTVEVLAGLNEKPAAEDGKKVEKK